MLLIDTHEALRAAHDRGRHLREEADAERLAGPARRRRAVAAVLRSAADCLDSAPFAQSAAATRPG